MNDYTKPFPGVLRIEPSASCNLKCIHCPTGTIEMERGVMKDETFDLILSQITATPLRVVVLYHGGEPLLNKRFPSMVKRIKEMGVPFVKTVSNGMIMTDSVMEKLIEARLDLIEISLDGDTKAENDFIRRGSEFDKVMANVKALVATKKKLGSTLPAVTICSTRFLPAADSQAAPPPCATPKYIADEFVGETEVTFKPTWAYVWPDMQVAEDVFVADPGHDTLNSCDHVENTVTVRWNGDVVPCCYDLTSKLVLGNVHDEPLHKIWNNDAYRELRRSIDKKDFNDLCKNCMVVNPGKHLRAKKGGLGLDAAKAPASDL